MALSDTLGVLRVAIKKTATNRMNVLASHARRHGVGNVTKEKSSTMVQRWGLSVHFLHIQLKVNIFTGTDKGMLKNNVLQSLLQAKKHSNTNVAVIQLFSREERQRSMETETHFESFQKHTQYCTVSRQQNLSPHCSIFLRTSHASCS